LRRKLTAQDIQAIRAARASGKTFGQLAIQFKMNKGQLWRAIRAKATLFKA
jgi:hypothetical protein